MNWVSGKDMFRALLSATGKHQALKCLHIVQTIYT